MSPVHELENRPMTITSPRRSYIPWIAMAGAMAMLLPGCASSSEAGPTEPSTKVGAGTTARSEPAVGETVLHLQGDVEVAIYADGRVNWAIGDGDPGYLQRRLTPEGVERLRSRAVSTGLFEQDQGLTLDYVDNPGLREHGVVRGSMEVRRGDRSVIVVWGRILPPSGRGPRHSSLATWRPRLQPLSRRRKSASSSRSSAIRRHGRCRAASTYNLRPRRSSRPALGLCTTPVCPTGRPCRL